MKLVYKGKNVCMGYSKTYKDLKKKDENNNILFTGDLARYVRINFSILLAE